MIRLVLEVEDKKHTTFYTIHVLQVPDVQERMLLGDHVIDVVFLEAL